jgi:hypothetical protein
MLGLCGNRGSLEKSDFWYVKLNLNFQLLNLLFTFLLEFPI